MTQPALGHARSGMSSSDTLTALSHRRGQLALALQEVLTATVRLRANRQVAEDAEAFRTQAKAVMAAAEQQARAVGYSSEDVKLALYAVVAFLDESVLNSTQPMFAAWPRKPLQDELFGGHVAGEMFFQNLRHLLSRQDSEDVADVLEVYQLCMLLGFQGRYSVAGTGELHALIQQTSEKIARVRGGFGPLSPAWAPPAGAIRAPTKDPWLRRLAVAAAATAALAVALYVVYKLSLGSAAAALQALAR